VFIFIGSHPWDNPTNPINLNLSMEDATMALDSHHVLAYNRNVQQLAGYQFESLIAPLFRQERERGEIASFDTIGQDVAGANDGATETAWADVDSYADYINTGTLTFDEFKVTRTPHNEVEKVRTLVAPKQIEWGYSFRKVDQIAELTDPTSRVMRQGQGKMKTSIDRYALEALTAASTLRGKTEAIATAVPTTFAAGGGIVLTAATANSFDIDDGNLAVQNFEDNYIDPMKENIIGILSPTMKRAMRIANPELRSRDFVDDYSVFAEFKLPKIDSVSYVCHPRVTAYRDLSGPGTYSDRVIFFTSEGLVWNEFDPIESFLDRNPDARYEYQAYMRMFANATRVDDKRVIWMDVLA
jgi:hypothetical protein